MIELLGFLGGLLQLALFGLIIWAIARAAGSRRQDDRDEGDRATSVRRLFTYGLLFATLMMTAIGAVEVIRALVGDTGTADESSVLALGLSLLLVGGCAFGLLLRHVHHRLTDVPGESRSFCWAAYVDLVLLVALIVVVVTTEELMEGVVGLGDFETATIAPVAVWGLVWTTHWFWLRKRYGVPGDLDLASGSLVGLTTLAIGVGGLVTVVGDRIYRWIVEQAPSGYDEPAARRWLIITAIGFAVWSWYWVREYMRHDRTTLWHVHVVLLGSLGGLVAALAATATAAYWLLVWFAGDRAGALPSEHFDIAPVTAGVVVAGVLTWRYHRHVLQTGEPGPRTDALRAYDHLMAASGFVATIVGATIGLVAIIEMVTPQPSDAPGVANRLILAITLVTIGAPLWWVFWSPCQQAAAADPVGELGSVVRRVHLIALFGVGALVTIVSLVVVLAIGFEDLFDGRFGGETVRSFRVPLALIITVTSGAWYHLGVYRADRAALRIAEPSPPAARPLHVVLVAPPSTDIGERLTAIPGIRLERWYRTDSVDVDVDVDDLAGDLLASESEDALVVVGPDGHVVVPFEA